MGTLRIIAGSMRGRRIRVPERPGVRPTSDRVRESLFNLLGQSLEGQEVLDLYSGSGALGLESLSRGGRRAVFVESDARSRKVLRENLAHLGVESKAKVVAGEVLEVIREGDLGSFDLVLADPPYEGEDAKVLPGALEGAGTLREGGTFAIEQDRRASCPPVPPGWRLTREAGYGRTVLRIFQRRS